MKALIISLESFQKGEVPEEVLKYISSQKEEPFIILDESSKIKTNNPCMASKKSKRTQAVLKLNTIGERCILTGTFMSKTPVNAFDQMEFLHKNYFPEGMFAFAERYEIRRNLPSHRGARILIDEKTYRQIYARLDRVRRDRALLSGTMDSIRSFYGISFEDCCFIMNNKEYTPFKNLDDLWKRIGDNCFKVSREDLFDIPPKVYKTVNLELTAEQRKLYLELQNLHCTDHITVDNGLKLYLRFQDICNGYEPVEYETEELDKDGNPVTEVELVNLKENPKIDALEEIIEEIGNEQCVVWCSRTKLLYDARARMEALGYTTGVYDGKIGNDEREKFYKDFSEGKIQLLFANPRSAGYGLDGLKKANYAVYLCNSYSVEERVQSEDRIYRGEVKTNKTIIDISFSGTCESRVTEALKQGKELLSTGVTDTSVFIYSEIA